MSWLSGKPRRVISLLWPENDPLIQARGSGFPSGPRTSWSVLDDQVLRSFTVREPDQQSSAVYLAKLYEIAQDGQGATTATFVKIATLPNAVHRIALLPDRVGFLSMEFTRETSSIMLRIHNWDGTISKEKRAHAAAAYGDLVVNRHSVAVCISSGQPSPDELLAGNPTVFQRVDAYDDSVLPPRDLTGDHILVWTFNSDTLTSVQIPQDKNAVLTHDACFQFIGDSHIALGGTLPSCFGRPAALLKAFRVDNRDGFTRTFTHGEHYDFESDIGVIAIPGSSGNNAVLVNYHHAGNRLTVVVNGLVSGDIDSQPNSDDPSGLHLFQDHPGLSRTIPGTISYFLPSISDNRLLVGRCIGFNDEAFKKFAIKQPHTDGTILFLYDFDQVRCNELLNITAEERISLEYALREENANAQVSVVERNFNISSREGDDADEDLEWSPEDEPPQEWIAHLQRLDKIGEARLNGTAEVPVLEFDEAPGTQKQNSRILFTRSAIWLPEDTDIRAINPNALALTTSGIVHMPHDFGKMGHFFCFADS